MALFMRLQLKLSRPGSTAGLGKLVLSPQMVGSVSNLLKMGGLRLVRACIVFEAAGVEPSEGTSRTARDANSFVGSPTTPCVLAGADGRRKARRTRFPSRFSINIVM